MNLRERMLSYEQTFDHKLPSKLPLIININGRSFSKYTSLLDKPFSDKLLEVFYSTCLRLAPEIEGSVFIYCFNDDITVVCRNDQNLETKPWYDNRIQKISSITASLTTNFFNQHINAMDLNVSGDAVFTSQALILPSIIETCNYLINKQQAALHTSIEQSCFYNLLKNFNKMEIKDMLNGLTLDEKIDLLKSKTRINFSNYPQVFRRGFAVYRTPKELPDGNIKYKWGLDPELPLFTNDQNFLLNLIS